MMCSTYEYKKIDKLSIKLDVYESEVSKLEGVSSKVIVYIHGGGFILGSRKDISHEHISFYNSAGYTLVSIDYRLAPFSKLKDIVDDINDAMRWIKEELNKYHDVDTKNIAVIGSSAGGYLSLMSGFSKNKPKVIISLYGYGDILDIWATKASKHYLKDILISESQADSLIRKEMISEVTNDRYLYYLYCRQSGNWIKEISGYNTLIQRERIKKFCPFYLIDENYPSTLLIHGDSDDDVPVEESIKLSRKLSEFKVNNKLIVLKKRGHEFDININKSGVKDVYESIIQFLDKNL